MKTDVTHYTLWRSKHPIGRTFTTEASARLYAKNLGFQDYTIVPVTRDLTDEETQELIRKAEQRAEFLDMEPDGEA